MKTKSKFQLLMLASVLTIALSNCSGKKEQSHEHEENTENNTPASDDKGTPQFKVDATFQQQLTAVFNSYVTLKDAFVASDASKVKEQAATTAKTLNNVDMKLLSGAAHNDWMNYLEGMNTSLKEIQNNDDIEAQRKLFSNLSDNLYKSIKAFGLGGTTVFYEFCPMAFNDQGAYWLSDNSAIRNPYFGDKMLTCGSVQEELK